MILLAWPSAPAIHNLDDDMTSHLGTPVAGKYHPLHNLVEIAIDPANFNREDAIAAAYHEAWHSLEFAQTLTEQRLLVESFPGGAAIERFLEEHPKFAAQALAALGPEALQDPAWAFGRAYVASMVCGSAEHRGARRALRRCWLWIVQESDKFEKLAPVERWRRVELRSRDKHEIPFLNDDLALVVYGEAAEQTRLASTTFKRAAEPTRDGGYRIGRGLLGVLREELRLAGYIARLHGPAVAFYDGRAERMSHEERTAYAFGAWGVEYEHRKSESDPILGKAVMALERFGNWRRGRGFQRLEDIFMRARHGGMWKRLDPASAHQTGAVPDSREAIQNGGRES